MPIEFAFQRGVNGEEIPQKQDVSSSGSAAPQNLGDDTAPLGLYMQRFGTFSQGFQKACRTQLASGLVNSLQHGIPSFRFIAAVPVHA